MLKIEAESMEVDFGGVRALGGVDFSFSQDEILGLIGPNGAGKTTAVNALTGFQRLTSGRISLGGEVMKPNPGRFVRMGLARTFQNVRLYGDLTCYQNIEAAALGIGCRRREAKRRAEELLESIGLENRRELRADALPFGEKRLLSIARALALDPKLLFLDEPAAGLSETETDALLRTITDIRAEYECGVLVIEHDMRLIMNLCERIHVLDHGKTIANGSRDEVRKDPQVIAAYLGSVSKRKERESKERENA